MKIKIRSRKRSHKCDGIGVRRIKTFSFSSDSAYDSVAYVPLIGTLFSLGHKLYASDYDSDSDSDSVASENQPLICTIHFLDTKDNFSAFFVLLTDFCATHFCPGAIVSRSIVSISGRIYKCRSVMVLYVSH